MSCPRAPSTLQPLSINPISLPFAVGTPLSRYPTLLGIAIVSLMIASSLIVLFYFLAVTTPSLSTASLLWFHRWSLYYTPWQNFPKSKLDINMSSYMIRVWMEIYAGSSVAVAHNLDFALFSFFFVKFFPPSLLSLVISTPLISYG